MDPVAFATVSSFSPYSPPTNRDNHSSATPEPDIQAVPLEELPRLSTETQRRNGFRQSNAPDRSARIIEDISNGNYSCSISWGNELNHVFNIHNPIRPQVENHEFHLASRLRPVMHSSQPFQYYERFSGSSSQTQHIAVDVDIKKGHWRMLKLNGPDLENEWMADAFKSNKTLPEFSDISEELIKTGIFTGISPDNPHMTIPELDLVISNMHPFLYGCGQQPFLRVFNVAGKARDEGIKMASKLWTNKYDESIVMRTASFGHGSQRLDMCVKEGNIRDGSGEQNVEGMHDDLLIPMALISAARKRVEEMDEDPSRC
ncbi:hypothetical protein B7494_g352 [Chlorociboria aeruginascens]|nr:hypothetical protein B7494_g352 [Chlorociboria aeruginascens]